VQAVLLPSSELVQRGAFVKGHGKFQQFNVAYHEDYHGLSSSPHCGVFARLDNVTSISLQSLQTSSNCRVKAVIESAVFHQASLGGKSKRIFPLSLNIFGPEDEADSIGEQLANAGVFLQHPCFLENGFEYYNPQYFYPDNKKTYLTYIIGLGESDIRAKRLSDEVEGVLTSLDDTSFLSGDTHDFVPEGIVTPLKRFQPIFNPQIRNFLILSIAIRKPR
jgi:hypothetical protein